MNAQYGFRKNLGKIAKCWRKFQPPSGQNIKYVSMQSVCSRPLFPQTLLIQIGETLNECCFENIIYLLPLVRFCHSDQWSAWVWQHQQGVEVYSMWKEQHRQSQSEKTCRDSFPGVCPLLSTLWVPEENKHSSEIPYSCLSYKETVREETQ